MRWDSLLNFAMVESKSNRLTEKKCVAVMFKFILCYSYELWSLQVGTNIYICTQNVNSFNDCKNFVVQKVNTYPNGKYKCLYKLLMRVSPLDQWRGNFKLLLRCWFKLFHLQICFSIYRLTWHLNFTFSCSFW